MHSIQSWNLWSWNVVWNVNTDMLNLQDEEGTPIKQDIKKGKLRFYPYNINWNYGLLPQTWEDPSHHNTEVDAAVNP